MRLLRAIQSWWRGGDPRTAGVQLPIDIEAVLKEPTTAKRMARCSAFLSEVHEVVLHETVRAVLAWIVDLPASEQHHHPERFGKFEHSLEVAEDALRLALSENFAETTAAWPEEQHYRVPRFRLATWAFGLTHDIGKVTGVRVHGPRRVLWNPFCEPLLAFYQRHGRANCTLSWHVGRGMDPHVWAQALIEGRVLPVALCEAIGPKILAEVLDQLTPAARRVQDFITLADQASAKSWLARKGADELEARKRALPGQLFVAVPDWVERVPQILAEAAADGILKVNETDGDLWITAEHVLIRYPKSVAKLARLVHDAVGRESIEVRSLSMSNDGAKLLANVLHSRRWLLHDPDTDGWRMHVKIALGDATDSTSAIALHRVFIEPALAALGPVHAFGGEIVLTRSLNGKVVRLKEETAELRADGPAARPPEATEPPKAEAPTETAPAAKPPATAPSPQRAAALRKLITSQTLLDDIRDAIVGGAIPANQWGGQAFVLEKVTYLVSPIGFERLVEAGIYDVDPKTGSRHYLDALGKLPCVRKHAAGRVLTSFELRPGARPAWAVAFETEGLFRSKKLIQEIGTWDQSAIRELSEEEHNAIVRQLGQKPTAGKEPLRA